jgi:hypothetical protein
VATATRKTAAKRRSPVRPVKDANFTPKRARKAERKRLIRKGVMRGHVGNAVADARMSARERAEFYRRLRELKQRRRKIADEFAVLVSITAGLQRDAQHVLDRHPDVDAGLLDEVMLLIKRAHASVGAAADEMQAFSRRKVFFIEMVGVAA